MKQKSASLLLVTCLSLLIGVAFSDRILAQSSDSTKVFNKQVYVEQSASSYYFYRVYSQNNTILIQILDQQVKSYSLTFKASTQSNLVYFRDAYYKYIIVEQKNSTGNTLYYWVIQIITTEQGYSLSSFSVSSRVDNQNFELADDYTFNKIIQYNRQTHFLYVDLFYDSGDQDIYGIDLQNKTNQLITISWFYYDKTTKEVILPGNSRVLVQYNSNQFWFDTRNKRNNDSDPTIFDKVNISSLTSYPIYEKGSRVYHFLGVTFQYVSLSSDKLNITTFTYRQYERSSVINQGSLNSTKEIKIYSDEESYFMAVGSEDAYISTVRWNSQISAYESYSTTLVSSITEQSRRSQLVQILYEAWIIVYNSDSKVFYLLSGQYFYVFSFSTYYKTEVNQSIDSSTTSVQLQKILFTYINTYKQSQK